MGRKSGVRHTESQGPPQNIGSLPAALGSTHRLLGNVHRSTRLRLPAHQLRAGTLPLGAEGKSPALCSVRPPTDRPASFMLREEWHHASWKLQLGRSAGMHGQQTADAGVRWPHVSSSALTRLGKRLGSCLLGCWHQGTACRPPRQPTTVRHDRGKRTAFQFLPGSTPQRSRDACAAVLSSDRPQGSGLGRLCLWSAPLLPAFPQHCFLPPRHTALCTGACSATTMCPGVTAHVIPSDNRSSHAFPAVACCLPFSPQGREC